MPLDWWSLSRDTAYYLMAVAILIGVLFDGRVYWFEAAAMLVVYGLYIAGELISQLTKVSSSKDINKYSLC